MRKNVAVKPTVYLDSPIVGTTLQFHVIVVAGPRSESLELPPQQKMSGEMTCASFQPAFSQQQGEMRVPLRCFSSASSCRMEGNRMVSCLLSE